MPTLHVLWTAGDARQHAFEPGDAAVVFDILRATTTITAALAAGARALCPVADRSSALALRDGLQPPPLLAGEENMQRQPGFDLGNSPLEMTPGAIAGRVLVLCTTNGTRAAAAALAAGCRQLLAASLLNRSATARYLAWARPDRITLICAGTQGRFSLDDVLGAGAVLEALLREDGTRWELTDAAQAALALWQHHRPQVERTLASCDHGRQLVRQGFAADVAFAARTDTADFAITWQPVEELPEPAGGGWFVPTHFPGNRRPSL
ncbi:2-phosphosulfolactate phosphatase [Thermaerobacter subterraneus]|uniref:Probable 2-phosphosulfolactate phosphatase n=1 Tax=Thermaerobacter subterraneus DSM 13965 TaxID=867903 RepID=K6Q1N2_9FIRM|nr:2-phosphosulfolactate phosphatase [Thermaerobacter subterraneus]EKP95063.1 phosphosulfolactate phosphohydrolase-like enzyme [Thermaerobacter subterraneus DSM 13965]